jgi:hypothetical protein
LRPVAFLNALAGDFEPHGADAIGDAGLRNRRVGVVICVFMTDGDATRGDHAIFWANLIFNEYKGVPLP